MILFSHGFRLFFLLAGLQGALAVPIWVLIYLGPGTVPSLFPPAAWHAHEMLFGYGVAAVAGFLLTATPNWTGRAPVKGMPLVVLGAVWLAGRAAAAFGSASPLLATVVDLAFVPILVVVLWPALRQAALRNRILLGVLALLFFGDAAMHLGALDITPGSIPTGEILAIDTLALLISIIGGRVVPAFTGNALPPGSEPVRAESRIDRLAILSVAATLLSDLVVPGAAAGAVAIAAAGLNAARMVGWRSGATVDRPILWVLHLGYAWLVFGLLWKGLAGVLDLLPPATASHGITVGAIGTMTLAVMSRAALGHTGRALVAPRPVALAYGLITAAALTRIAAPFVPGEATVVMLAASSSLWSIAFALFLIVYVPILLSPRVDTGAA